MRIFKKLRVLVFFATLFVVSIACAHPINIQLGGSTKGRTDALFPRTDPRLIGGTYQLLYLLDMIFNEEGIPYWADFGILFGAVRNGSMIPWEDDGDVGAFLKDRERILALNERLEPEGLEIIVSPENDLLIFHYKGKRLPFVDIFLYVEDPAAPDQKMRLAGIPYKWWPKMRWYKHELQQFTRIKYGPVELNAPYLGQIRHLLERYGDNCLDKAVYWGHRYLEAIREEVQITDFSPGEYVLEDLSIPLDGPHYESDRISFGALLHDPVTEHVRVLAKLLDGVKIKGCVEFWLGKGTKYLLEWCDCVSSVEVLAPGQSDTWYKEAQDLFGHYDHWDSKLHRGSSSVAFAEGVAQGGKDPDLYDSSYLPELKDACDSILGSKVVEFALVDWGFHFSGALVNELFDRAEIIAVHNTGKNGTSRGVNKVCTPSNYVKIHFPESGGVTFWVSTKRPDVIFHLGGVIKPARTGLRVFFPNVHERLTEAMARALNCCGHTLVLAGKSFDPHVRSRGYKFHIGKCGNERFKHAHPNVEIIENGEMMRNPPDIFFVNVAIERNEQEKEINKLVRHLYYRKGKAVKLAHLSSENAMDFYHPLVLNLVQADVKTADLFLGDAKNVTSWQPWIDFDGLSFAGGSDARVIGSYLGGYYPKGNSEGKRLFDTSVPALRHYVPGLSINNVGGLTSSQVIERMRSSAATLHIKEDVGVGFTILESLALGRPVFLKRSFSLGNRMMNWCIEGKTAFFFDSEEELSQKVARYMEDVEYRHEAQQTCAQTVRRIIDNEK